MFNATFNMFMLNGTAAHKHGTMTDFKISGNPTTAMLCYLQWYSHCITKESIKDRIKDELAVISLYHESMLYFSSGYKYIQFIYCNFSSPLRDFS